MCSASRRSGDPGRGAGGGAAHPLNEEFGKADSSLGRDDHWSLKVDGGDLPAINVLVNGTGEIPAVWVFDPHSLSDGVMRAAIDHSDRLEEAIRKIQERVKSARRRS